MKHLYISYLLYHRSNFEHDVSSVVVVVGGVGWGRGSGGGGGGGCKPVFRNLPNSYTRPLKKRTRLYTWASEMLTYSYIAL